MVIGGLLHVIIVDIMLCAQNIMVKFGQVKIQIIRAFCYGVLRRLAHLLRLLLLLRLVIHIIME